MKIKNHVLSILSEIWTYPYPPKSTGLHSGGTNFRPQRRQDGCRAAADTLLLLPLRSALPEPERVITGDRDVSIRKLFCLEIGGRKGARTNGGGQIGMGGGDELKLSTASRLIWAVAHDLLYVTYTSSRESVLNWTVTCTSELQAALAVKNFSYSFYFF